MLQKNVFVERILPASVLRGLTEAEMAVYRRPFLEPGESRPPDADLAAGDPDRRRAGRRRGDRRRLRAMARRAADLPKLFVNAEPGFILTGAQREFCRRWPNQQEVTVRGSHFVQEDSPAEIGEAVAAFVRAAAALE